MLTKQQKQYLRSSILRYRSPQSIKMNQSEQFRCHSELEQSYNSKEFNYYLNHTQPKKKEAYISPRKVSHFRAYTEYTQIEFNIKLVKPMVLLMNLMSTLNLKAKQQALKEVQRYGSSKYYKINTALKILASILKTKRLSNFYFLQSFLKSEKEKKQKKVINANQIQRVLHSRQLRLMKSALQQMEIKAIKQNFINKHINLFFTQLQNVQKTINLRAGLNRLKHKWMKSSLRKRSQTQGITKVQTVLISKIREIFFILQNQRPNRLTFKGKLKRSDSQQSSQNPQDSHSMIEDENKDMKSQLLFRSEIYSIYLNQNERNSTSIKNASEQLINNYQYMHGEEILIERIINQSYHLNERHLAIKGRRDRSKSPNKEITQMIDYLEFSEKSAESNKGRSQTLRTKKQSKRGSLRNLSLFVLFKNDKQDSNLAKVVKRVVKKSQTIDYVLPEATLSIRQIEDEKSPIQHYTRRSPPAQRLKRLSTIYIKSVQKKVKIAISIIIIAVILIYCILYISIV